MSRLDMTLKIDATCGLKIRPGDKIHKGQNISTSQQQQIVSTVSGTVKSVLFDSDNHEFIVVISQNG